MYMSIKNALHKTSWREFHAFQWQAFLSIHRATLPVVESTLLHIGYDEECYRPFWVDSSI